MPSRPLTNELIYHYTFSEPDLSTIRQRRGNHNRLGFAVQLCYLRYPGFVLPTDEVPIEPLLAIVGRQLRIKPEIWPQYARRPGTRREHLAELQALLNLTPFAIADFRRFVHQLSNLAQQTDRGIVLAEALVEMLRQQRIIMPAIDVIEHMCSEALTRGTRQVYEVLTTPLSHHHRKALDGLLKLRESTKGSSLIWLRQPPGPAKPKHILIHLERLKAFRELGLPEGLEHTVHQNRLLKLAREGGLMTAQHLRDLEPARRYATLIAVMLVNRLGEIRDRSFENQRYRASGLNLVVAAIVLWNTVYLERAVRALRDSGKVVDDKLLQYLSPLGWDHINLTGDYIWRQSKQVEKGKFRPLRMLDEA